MQCEIYAGVDTYRDPFDMSLSRSRYAYSGQLHSSLNVSSFRTLADACRRATCDAVCMGNRRPERDARWICMPADPLKLYAKDYALIARCRRCHHWGELQIGLLLRELGADAPMERVDA